jgi:hypothetical protein
MCENHHDLHATFWASKKVKPLLEPLNQHKYNMLRNYFSSAKEKQLVDLLIWAIDQ